MHRGVHLRLRQENVFASAVRCDEAVAVAVRGEAPWIGLEEVD